MDFNSVSLGTSQPQLQDQLTERLGRDFPQRPQGEQPKPAPVQLSALTRTVDKLLGKLAELLSQDISATEPDAAAVAQGGQAGSEEVNPLEASIQLAEEILALLNQEQQLSTTFAVPDMAELQQQLEQYVAIVKALEQLEGIMDDLESAEKSEVDQARYENALALLEHLAEMYERRLKRMTDASWYAQWRLTYIDEMETKHNLRTHQYDPGQSPRSLPKGVSAPDAQAVLLDRLARPDLIHATDVIEGLVPLPQTPAAAATPYV
ncbi:MAG: hypothetical protein ACAI44_17240 [Candidatus Sericytochromatia bacterium]